MKETEFVYENLKRKMGYSTQKIGIEIIFSIKIMDMNLSKILPDYFEMIYDEISGKLI